MNPGFYGLTLINGHLYEFYPPGTGVFSTPAVFLAKAVGKDVVNDHDKYVVSKAISIALNLLIYYLLFLLGRFFVSESASFGITTVSFMGGSLTSTLGGSLTSHHYTVLFSLLTFFLLLREEAGRGGPASPYVVGILLFSSFLCRPASACFIAVTLGYLFFKRRKFFFKTAVVSFLLLSGFVAFSLFEFGSPLPPYYHLFSTYVESGAGRAGENNGFLAALYGTLLSPSRGLFVFSPFLLVVAAGTIYAFKRLRHDGMFWLCLGWFLTSVLLIANWFSWEGGHSFGPRLFADSFPSLILLSFLLWNRIGRMEKSKRFKRLAIAAYAVLGAFAIWVNSYQGLYNEWVLWWNKVPPLGVNVKRFVCDWRYPQFLASEVRTKDRIVDYYGHPAGDLEVGDLGARLKHYRRIMLLDVRENRSP